MATLAESITEQIYDLSTADLVTLNNTYCQARDYSDDEVYSNDNEFFDTFFENKPMEAIRSAHFGSYNYADIHVKFDGYGNLESFSNFGVDDLVDAVSAIADYAIDNQDAFSELLDFDVEVDEEED